MTDDAAFVEYGSDMMIIREIFDGAHELFETELERALDIGCQTIVIEPCRLGDETARWIFMGDCLAKSSVLTGLGSIMTSLVCPDRHIAQYSLLATSLLANSIHMLTWQSDICSHYRVERNHAIKQKSQPVNQCYYDYEDNYSGLPSSPDSELSTSEIISNLKCTKSDHQYTKIFYSPKSKPVILCRRTNAEIRRSNIFTAAVSLLALAFSMWRLFKSSFVKFTLI